MKLNKKHAGAVALALAVALAGCTDGGGTETPTTSKGSWRVLSSVSRQTYAIGDARDTRTEEIVYELDERGLVRKATTVETTDSDWDHSRTEVVRELGYDAEGWLTAETRTETTTSVDPDDPDAASDAGEPLVNTFEYRYERDDEGRVVKASSSDPAAASVELAYDKDGNVVQTIARGEGSLFGIESVEATATAQRDANGTILSSRLVGTDETGATTFDVTRDYSYERDDEGRCVKETLVVVGDGASSMQVDIEGDLGKSVRETYLPDGSIEVQEVAYSSEGAEVLGEAQRYSGPYYTVERSFDEKGNATSELHTFYDGTTERHEMTYDDAGNMLTERIVYADGTERSYEYGYDEAGNQVSAKLVDRTSPEGANSCLVGDESTVAWTMLDELAPFAALNERYLGWI